MPCLNITSTFFSVESVNQLYSELEILAVGKPIYIHAGHKLDYEHQSPNQIITIQPGAKGQDVLTYNSAQNYYQSEKVKVMERLDLAERVRVSRSPLADGHVPEHDFINNADEWNRRKVDVAFKCNWLKFMQNKDLAHELLLTGNRPIVSTREAFWGDICGKTLMIIREDLRRRAYD